MWAEDSDVPVVGELNYVEINAIKKIKNGSDCASWVFYSTESNMLKMLNCADSLASFDYLPYMDLEIEA